jgi:predicted lysophospholipase L1 biosynthesis ABC-type transport system permease subunit
VLRKQASAADRIRRRFFAKIWLAIFSILIGAVIACVVPLAAVIILAQVLPPSSPLLSEKAFLMALSILMVVALLLPIALIEKICRRTTLKNGLVLKSIYLSLPFVNLMLVSDELSKLKRSED